LIGFQNGFFSIFDLKKLVTIFYKKATIDEPIVSISITKDNQLAYVAVGYCKVRIFDIKNNEFYKIGDSPKLEQLR